MMRSPFLVVLASLLATSPCRLDARREKSSLKETLLDHIQATHQDEAHHKARQGDLGDKFDRCLTMLRLPVKEEQQALELTLERIRGADLTDLPELKQLLGALARDLLSIPSTSPRYTLIMNVVGDFLTAAFAQQLKQLLEAQPATMAPEELLIIILPLMQAALVLLDPHPPLVATLQGINKNIVEAITWHTWLNQIQQDKNMIAQLLPQINQLRTQTESLYATLQQQVATTCEAVMAQLQCARSQLAGWQAQQAYYTDLHSKANS